MVRAICVLVILAIMLPVFLIGCGENDSVEVEVGSNPSRPPVSNSTDETTPSPTFNPSSPGDTPAVTSNPTPIRPSFTVTSPSGGESWQLGSSHAITWTSNNTSSIYYVKIDLYRNGVYYTRIDSSELNDGSYTWIIPTDYDLASSYQVRVTSANNPSVYDDSNSHFSLTPEPSFIVTSPSGGESWQLGSSHTITWTSTNVSSNVKIDLYNSGSHYTSIDANVPNIGSYTWSIPTGFTLSNSYQVRIASMNNPSVYDASDNYFSLAPQSPFAVISPNGSESWQLGSSHTITWTSASVSSSYVKIDLYKNGSWYTTIDGNEPNAGSYTWTVPIGLAVANSYRVRITAIDNPSLYDASDNYFSLSTQPSITVISPNNGERWQLGSSHSIIWTSGNIGSNYVKIDLYRNGNYITPIHGRTPNTGVYVWTIPTRLPPSNFYQVGILATNNPSAGDFSNNYFSLTR